MLLLSNPACSIAYTKSRPSILFPACELTMISVFVFISFYTPTYNSAINTKVFSETCVPEVIIGWGTIVPESTLASLMAASGLWIKYWLEILSCNKPETRKQIRAIFGTSHIIISSTRTQLTWCDAFTFSGQRSTSPSLANKNVDKPPGSPYLVHYIRRRQPYQPKPRKSAVSTVFGKTSTLACLNTDIANFHRVFFSS